MVVVLRTDKWTLFTLLDTICRESHRSGHEGNLVEDSFLGHMRSHEVQRLPVIGPLSTGAYQIMNKQEICRHLPMDGR